VAPATGEEAAGCVVASRDPEEGWVAPPLGGKFRAGPRGGVLTGGGGGGLTGREGGLTVGVVTGGVVTCGVVTCGVVIGPAVTVGVGVVADGTVTEGTVTDGTDTVGSGEDAAAGAAGRTSAPISANASRTVHAVAMNHDHLPHGLSTDDGADMAHRPKVPPALRARNFRTPQLTPPNPA
jgi:hypothetical protein